MSTPTPCRSAHSPDPVQFRRWPHPTTLQPNVETLTTWCFDDGGCVATNGCWVEIDGVCPHGHPSWFIHFELMIPME